MHGDEEIINPLKGNSQYGWHFEQQVYDAKGITRAVKAGGGSGNIPKLIEPMCSVHPTGRKLEFDINKSIKEIAPTLRATDYKSPCCAWLPLENNKKEQNMDNSNLNLKEHKFRIRKLTPRECFRLMGVDEKNIDKIQDAGISNSQQYKLAGNSIVVDVLFHIFRTLFVEQEEESTEQTLF